MTLTQVLGRFVRFNRCKANSSPSLHCGPGRDLSSHLAITCVSGCVSILLVTHSAAPAHSKTGLSWGRRRGGTTLNGSTMTSHTLPEEKKSWVRKRFHMASVTHRLCCLGGWPGLRLGWKFVLFVVVFSFFSVLLPLTSAYL